jgi:protein-disulfide isomerase
MPYRSIRAFRPALAALGAAALLAAACSRGDAAGTSSKAAPPAANTAASAAGAAPATAKPAQDSIAARADRGRILGDSAAKVWLVVASDFQCPYCKQWHDAQFANIVQKYVKTGRVRIAYLNMPLTGIHQFAKPAAEAAMCASVQDRFWQMHDSLFATQNIWEKLQNPGTFFDTLANHNRLDMPSWRTCFSQHLTIPLIDADYSRAHETGVISTPTFIIGATKLASADADVAGALDAALAAKAKP